SVPFRPLWLGNKGALWASVVTVSEPGKADLGALARAHEGAEYVDHFSELSALMGRFRARVGWLLVIGYAVVALFLLGVYRGDAWRILLPTLLASLFVAGFFGWLGLNYNL